jgi:WXG100 family type VII secretion target
VIDLYKIDLPRLAEAIDAMAAFDRHAEAIIAEVDRRIAVLHVESWSGGAASAQRQYHDKWIRDAQRMRDSLSTLRQAAVHAHRAYSDAHTINASMWESE